MLTVGQKPNTISHRFLTRPIFSFNTRGLERQPLKDIYANAIPYVDGIISKTFETLSSPEYIPLRKKDESGVNVTTLIDKRQKLYKPIEAYVAMIKEEDPLLERYIIMIQDNNGDMNIGNKRYTTVGETHFYINNEEKMIMPKSDVALIDNEFGEKELCFESDSYIMSYDNEHFDGIGVRLVQVRTESMLIHQLGNICIIADGKSFPFHYKMGYRLPPKYTDKSNYSNVAIELCGFNKKTPEYNMRFVSYENKDGKQFINVSHSIENCLYDYYINGGASIINFKPYMYLTETAARQWVNKLIKEQSILF